MEVERDVAESGGHSLLGRTLEPFFITGLPRSRTAWMAAFFTDGDMFCHHELLNRCASRDEFYRGMRHHALKIGNSDSGLVLTDFQDRFPESKTVVIRRPRDEVFGSMENVFSPDVPLSRAAFENIADNVDRLKGMRVDFDDLDSALESICEYLEVPYNRLRHRMFERLNIQTTDLELRHDIVNLWR